MKTIPIALATHYTGSSTKTLCQCIKVTRKIDDVSFGFTTLDVPLDIDGLTYEPGSETSNLISSSGLAVDNLEITIIPDAPGGAVNREDLAAGLWNYSTFEIFEVNYRAPGDGIDVLKRGTGGEVQIRRGSFVVELRGLTQGLQQPVGIVTSKTCRANFADFPQARLNAPCRINPNDWTESGTLTGVTNNQVFTDSVRAEADDWFVEGLITWTGGLNDGFSQKVKAFASGLITLSLPMFFEVQVGDTYSMIAGCQKRHDVDCKTKFNNILNFQGEPHLVGVDIITGAPDVV